VRCIRAIAEGKEVSAKEDLGKFMSFDNLADLLRRGEFAVDCRKLTVRRTVGNRESYSGPGFIKQAADGTFEFKIHVSRSGLRTLKKGMRHLGDQLRNAPRSHEYPWSLVAEAHGSVTWTAKRAMPRFHFDFRDGHLIITGRVHRISSKYEWPLRGNALKIYFFEKYSIPLHLLSDVSEGEANYKVRDRTEFEAIGLKFEVRCHEKLAYTLFSVSSDSRIPGQLHLRVQEALQFITGRSATWRARAELHNGFCTTELSSPWGQMPEATLHPPIHPATMQLNSRNHGWGLFADFLAYVLRTTKDTHWNLVAYHIFNARQTSAGSIDAWAAGVSIALEALTSLVKLPGDRQQRTRISKFYKAVAQLLNSKSDLEADLVTRALDMLRPMNRARPQERLKSLSRLGFIEKAYIKNWGPLRNRHVHPKLMGLRRPSQADSRKLIRTILEVEVLLYQVAFFLIKYEGEYTDYGKENWPLAKYPLNSN
jgi:hypothetical protein